MPPSRRAFSLADLVAALAITAVLLALALPSFSRALDRAAVRAATREAMELLAECRRVAMARHALVACRIDAAAGRVVLHAESDTVMALSLRERYGVRLGANRDSLAYDGRGAGYGAANLTLSISRGAMAETLTVSRLGRVR
ncbi:MAG: hypothetical protein JWO05_2709 [Gemmatimonadetes bacterium]|nr:hypothetical protein [Gemmatimonadota bacterium]